MRRPILIALATAILSSAAPSGSAGQTALETRSPKSAATAITLSALGTVAPIVLGITGALPADDYDGGYNALLVLYGIYLGPATGYFYAGEPGRGTRGAGVRAGITLGTALMIGMVCSSGGCELLGGNTSAVPVAGVILLGGMAGMVGSIAYDIASAGGAARRWNAKHAGANISVLPTLDPVTGTPSVAVSIPF